MKTPLQFFTGLTLAFTISLLSPSLAIGQTQKSERQDVYTFVEQMPVFEGGEAGMMQYIGQNLRYAEGLHGGLLVASFVVNPDSSVSDVAILKGLHPELEKESVRVIESMSGKWVPGRQNGKLVAVRFTLPIRFEGSEQKQLKQENKRQLPEKEVQALQSDVPFTKVDQMPTYQGGEDELLHFLREAVPSSRNQKGLSVFTFVVNRDGSISDVEVIKSQHAATDKKIADALLSTSGKWTPGQQFEYKVRVRYTLPINYPIKKTQQSKVTVTPVGS
ncbi:energy transducer TonB [Pontibacter sp. BT731]|uniref:energy transducer TonB n=1 Tax=Pontibacter coccineus TaxID=3063328 RepID=UPI0026E32FD2|nr:energy transducer TonB [Pontibacter sp. BT731]MDO6390268.1 energy transducer TonB [Pontibacter sp. BT731]